MPREKDTVGATSSESAPPPLPQPSLFDEATTRRDAALDQVAANAGPSFRDRVFEAVQDLRGLELTGEAIRTHCAKLGIVPHHHNAWGAIINSLVRRGLLVDTGRTARMRNPESHARKTTVWFVR